MIVEEVDHKDREHHQFKNPNTIYQLEIIYLEKRIKKLKYLLQ